MLGAISTLPHEVHEHDRHCVTDESIVSLLRFLIKVFDWDPTLKKLQY
ncbi:hypothetical protein A1F94_005305 [Pyrenophora tritici-repentis]|uniref:Uncharacterized protein n=1 Tax=Pyrenophora tritici-repentis TaxID=45151 RepID=A0A834RUD6_9PLEO|nr:hypothetical protein PtrM4_102020 [Pyrenophora tritici-repentis]KAG9383394.1 hypothetical protein A1F94_005305 [Pyrenophora tritici-repentis]